VVDEDALLNAMNEGLVRDCVIDTWENEPNINPCLLEKAMIATPHIAGYSANGKMNATRMTLQSVAEWAGIQIDFPNLSDITSLVSVPEPCRRTHLTTSTLLSDSDLLKARPEDFEAFRSNYPQRVE